MRKYLGLAVMFVAVPAIAAGNSPTKSVDDDQQMVCKSQQRTNSRLPKKTCMTKAQWDRMSEQAKRDAKDMIDRPQIEIRRD